MAVTKIHHINFLVKDINEGVQRYSELFGIEGFVLDTLPGRGVITARAALGEQWLVLVQPLDAKSIPGKHMEKHGEGFFLISYAVEDLAEAASRVVLAGAAMTSSEPREGLLGWRVQDVAQKTFGVQVQLCEDEPR
ncbi:MAG: VOC family protein [Halioglobus sp.]